MKAVVSVATVFLSSLLAVNANVILTDTFSYPNGPLVGAQGSPWQNHSGPQQEIQVTNGAIRLTFAAGEDANASLSGAPYDTTNNPSVTALYSSFRIKLTALPTASGQYFAHFRDNEFGFRCRVYALTNGTGVVGNYRLGIGSTNSQSTSLGFASWGSDLSTGVTYTVVTRLVLADGTSTLWIDPTNEADPSVSSTANPGNPNAIATYAFRQTGGIGTMLIDDLRVGTSFADVAGPNSPPSISGIPDQSTAAGTTVGPISFTVDDAETPASGLILSKMSTNSALVPESNIVFGGSGSNRTVTITPVPNVQGQTEVTISVSDGETIASVAFLVSVGFPTISEIPDQETQVNTATAQIPFTIGDAETAATSLTITASSDNEFLVPNENIVFGGSGSNRTIIVTPTLDQAGLARITVTVSDGQVASQQTFLLTVYPILGLVKTDDFNRPDGPLAGTSGWRSHNGTLQETQITNNQVKLSSSQTEDVSNELTGAPYSPGGGHILYTSFAVNFIGLPSPSGGYFAHFKDLNNEFRCRVYASTANAAAGKFRLGIANNAASIGADAQWPADLSRGVTYVVMTKYNVGTGQSTLWVNPFSESSPAVTASDNPSTATIWYYAFRQTTGIGTLCLDNLNVGGSFATVLIPRLRIGANGGMVAVSWPAAAADYRLEATASLSPESWGAVTEMPQIIGDTKVVTFVQPAGDRFFRLVKP